MLKERDGVCVHSTREGLNKGLCECTHTHAHAHTQALTYAFICLVPKYKRSRSSYDCRHLRLIPRPDQRDKVLVKHRLAVPIQRFYTRTHAQEHNTHAHKNTTHLHTHKHTRHLHTHKNKNTLAHTQTHRTLAHKHIPTCTHKCWC